MFHNSTESWPIDQGAQAHGARQPRQYSVPAAIAVAALKLAPVATPLILGPGRLTRAMAERMSSGDYRVLSPAIDIVDVLLSRANVRVTVPGGTVFRDHGLIVSPYDDTLLRRFAAVRMFIEAERLSRDGVLLSDALVVHTLRSWLERADEVIVLASSGRLQSGAGLSLCALSRISTVITDDAIAADVLKTLVLAGVKLQIVSSSGRR